MKRSNHNPSVSARYLVALGMWLLWLQPSPALATMLAPGTAFPAWKLPDQAGRERSSTELAGKPYLLWFYPRASTPGCTAEGRGLRDTFAEIQAAGFTVIGVSFDAPADNAAFAASERFPFPLLSDRARTLALAVGAADSAAQVVARRISYLVGGDGRVLVAYDAVDPSRHAAQVLADIQRLSDHASDGGRSSVAGQSGRAAANAGANPQR